jgi:tRNA pseudouridine55 synthase
VTIRSLDMLECAPPRVVLDVQCSAGTYIRTLAQDIGAALGCGAHLTGLTRLGSGGFSLQQAHSLAELEALDPAQRRDLLLPPDCLVAHLPAVQLDASDAAALCQGRSVVHPSAEPGLTRVYTAAHTFLGLVHVESGQLVPRRLLATQQRT